MQILEVKSANDKEAVKKASQILNIDPDNIEARLHIKGGGGFLGIGSKEPSIYKIYAIPGKTSNDAVITGVLTQITAKMGYNVQVESIEKTEEEKMYVVMSSENAGHIIGKRGKTLESLQFIVNLVSQQFTGEPPKILLDIENYRKRREKYLTDLALKVADSVIRHGKSRLLEPLNPFERRLVHVALQEDDRVETESEGTGVYKRVRIKLQSRKQDIAEEGSDILIGSEENEEHHDIDDNDVLIGNDQPEGFVADGNTCEENPTFNS